VSHSIRLVTWNIHGAIGRDGRHDIRRILDVLHEVDADVVALQEVASLGLEDGLLQAVRDDLRMHVVTGRTLTRRNADYGNALLSRHAVTRSTSIDLTVGGHEPRNAIDARIAMDHRELRVVATHLGLRPAERRTQVKRLLAALEDGPSGACIVMGDLNEWYLWGRPLRWLHAKFAAPRTPATFPARRPMLKLDRIWAHPTSALESLRSHRSALARVASDHLPLVATYRLAPVTSSPAPAACLSTARSTP
jgi:endonuclease/exonuclease/phosphatase family metal-dependent hydrolase